MVKIKNLAVLITCHNRKDKTINCLTALYNCVLPENHFFEVFLVDDGSTDGTSEAIKTQFTSVRIIQGDGNLYWNRGMHLAWETAKKAKDFDYYLWLNDDTFLFENALKVLFEKSYNFAIVCGTTQSIIDKTITYGGFDKKSNRLKMPNGIYQECDFINGNCVLIPKAVFEKIGNLDSFFHHAVGDFDYGLRARKVGIILFIATDYVGNCEDHSSLPKWRSPKTPLIKRLESLYHPTSGCSPLQFFVFDRRHKGLLIACFHFFTIHLRAVFPLLWNK
jgi:GT2 family glycosyltransferase